MTLPDNHVTLASHSSSQGSVAVIKYRQKVHGLDRSPLDTCPEMLVASLPYNHVTQFREVGVSTQKRGYVHPRKRVGRDLLVLVCIFL